MRLTRYTDFALRVLLYLGRQPDQLASIAEIARGYAVSQSHLMKVVSDLVGADYVDPSLDEKSMIGYLVKTYVLSPLRPAPKDVGAREAAAGDEVLAPREDRLREAARAAGL